MSDVVVTVPKNFRYADAPGLKGLAAWIAEGDAAGDESSFSPFDEWAFAIGRNRPDIREGERVYVVCEGKLRGYAPLIRVAESFTRVSVQNTGDKSTRYTYALIRGSGSTAVAVTIPAPIVGFRGWRYRWWSREIEVPFPDWMTP